MPVQRYLGGVTGVGGGDGLAHTMGGFVGGYDVERRLHDVRQVLAFIPYIQVQCSSPSVYNTFAQLDEEEREEQVVEIYPAGGAAVQWPAFLSKNMVEYNLASKMFKDCYMSEVLVHFAAAL
ncbi:hypothetical protein CgunFtcFv8_023370 [Champsocephalus gunnari]|uniref:Uncharacterized protein n=1 Tax=Champsocephalus gunnari TaxID=52237 RepID=A0AAN8HLC0_CHAGU|nr:hypothetical protein CgunFtcFv8_023370 [Champsocephalus gunnari]